MHRAGKSSAGNLAENQVWHAARRTGWPAIAAVFVATVLSTGCGQNYRPVVSAINPVGPAGQPTKFAVALSSPTTTGLGLVTIVDFSGDTVLATPSILSNPSYFAIGASEAFVINASGALDTFFVTNPASLLTSDVAHTTLVANSNPVSITPIANSAAGTVIFIPQSGPGTPASPSVAALSSTGPSLLQNLSVGLNPNYVVGLSGAARVYALSGGSASGQAAAIETTTTLPTISATITVGNNPIYGIMSADLQRAFIVNKGSGTVSVINVQTNALDATTPVIPASGTLGVNPVWAAPVTALSEIVVLNAGDGTNPGSLSIISVPLCNAATPINNPGCNTNNPSDALGFGTVIATVPVGVNPSMVDVLKDGSVAYVVNQSNVPGVCNGQGSVSVVSLTSNQVRTTICGVSGAAANDPAINPGLVFGHPNTVSVTSGNPTGKVYITAADDKYMTVLRTDVDAVQTHISIQGTGVPAPLAGSNHPQSPGVLVTAP